MCGRSAAEAGPAIAAMTSAPTSRRSRGRKGESPAQVITTPILHGPAPPSSAVWTLRQFAAEFRELVDRARKGRSLPDDLTGGTFTITNLGMYDVDAFTPVINLPEAAILGVGRIVERVVPCDGQPVIRPMMALSLSFDHRIVDGAPAARFLQRVKQLVERPLALLLRR